MKFSLDFDGIFTDESLLDLSVVNKEWFFWSEQSIMYSPIKKGIRQLSSLLQYFGEVIITTARPVSHHKTIRTWLSRYAPELTNTYIVSSCKQEKLSILISEEVQIHVDDDFLNKYDLNDNCPCMVVWSSESPAEIFTIVCEALNECLKRTGRQTHISVLALGSVTPTFLIKSTDRISKLKIFQSPDDLERVRQFYLATRNLHDVVFLPTDLNWSFLWLETEYVEGVMAEEATTEERNNAIPYLAVFLKKLHMLSSMADGFLVSCAVDRFNVCLTTDKRIALIDIGDCLVSNKWIDVVWAEQLYCQTDDERNSFIEHYIDKNDIICVDEIAEALREYYSWLHYVIARGRNWNSEDITMKTKSNHISDLRSLPPSDSLLLKIARETKTTLLFPDSLATSE